MLAEKLGMFVSDILRMSAKEFEYWKCYYEVKQKLEEDAQKKAARK